MRAGSNQPARTVSYTSSATHDGGRSHDAVARAAADCTAHRPRRHDRRQPACLAGVFRQLPAARDIEVRPGDFERFDGVSLPKIPEGLRARYGIDEPLDELRREYEEAVEAAYAAVEPAPGARELVRVVHDAGVALALVTSAPRRLATSFLASSGMLASFAAVVAGEDAPPKPDPSIFLVALRRVRVAPDDAIAVEDSLAGVASARGAGLRVVGIASEPGRAAALAEAGARPVLSDLHPLASAFATCTDPTP